VGKDFSSHSLLRHRFGATLPAALCVLTLLIPSAFGAAVSVPQNAHVDGSSVVADLLRKKLSGSSTVQIGDETLQAEPLRRIYSTRSYEPIWTGSEAAEANAKLALDALGNADAQGLQAANYRKAQLTETYAAGDDKNAALELLLTDSLLRYARDLRSGRERSVEVEADAGLPSVGFDYSSALASALADGALSSFIDDLTPKHPEYARLKKALARYRAIEAAGGWPGVPQDVAPDGDNADLLRARLVVEDETAADGDLTEALQRYQSRNGLNPDGVIGPRTLAALNVSVATRIGQIRANMERWRWMPREFEPRRIVVNVPAATLDYFDKGDVVLHSNVIVGNLAKRTPIIRAEATAVTVNPVWYIPASITWNEIVPRLRRNPNYLQNQGYVVSGRQILQPPGPRNALGRLKFEMPNNFGVYLHDTPSRALFERDGRTLSHGCVRVEQIVPLASLAISGDANTMMDELSNMIAARKTTRLALSARIPVYMLYWTAIADDDGHAGFPRDVYGRDPLLLSALSGARVNPHTTSAALGP
jgi:murein L,D-transpeptidase YcbB/YkuD